MSPANSFLTELLTAFQQGQVQLADVLKHLDRPAQSAPTSDAVVDVGRSVRCGYPEVVYGPGKTPESVVEIFQTLLRHGQACLVTRANAEQFSALQAAFPNAICNPIGRTLRLNSPAPSAPVGRVLVVTAGTSDRPIAEEAVETLRWMNCAADLILDVGVAGPHRLPERLQQLQAADVIVVVAGMEGALPSIVGGYVSCPVVGVPTSQGYGANFGGLSALLGMLNSCAANVTVVNIDAGFKGGYVAGLIAQRRVQSGS